ncbi:MAG: hypothetical protein J6575_04475 [Bifidobacterium sp.]|nr:hypothetical protein [Bifidobacterium sp.]
MDGNTIILQMPANADAYVKASTVQGRTGSELNADLAEYLEDYLESLAAGPVSTGHTLRTADDVDKWYESIDAGKGDA